jgi:hypothetical protein
MSGAKTPPGRAEVPQPSLGEAQDTPWDPELAEALMRVWEQDAAQWRENAAARPAWSQRVHREPVAPQSAEAQRRRDVAASEGGAAATGIATTVARLEVLEARFAETLTAVAQSGGAASLEALGGPIGDLVARLEGLRSQLDRLESVERNVSELAARLNFADPRRRNAAAPEAPHETSAAALRQLGAATGPPWRERFDALEALLSAYASERRRGEEALAGALRAIEAALARIAEAAAASDTGSHQREAMRSTAERALEDEDRRLLVAAYAEGTRVLGEDALEPALDAANYARFPTAGTERGAARGLGPAGIYEGAPAAARASLVAKLFSKLHELARPRRHTWGTDGPYGGDRVAGVFGATRERRLFAIAAIAAALAAYGLWFARAALSA